MARIFVADDNPQVADILSRMLQREGHAIEAYSDGASLLARIGADQPDLFILDVVMPGIGGFEVCTRLKADPATRLVPVVLVTGLGDSESRLQGIEAGADDFLTKPFDRSELLARVRSLLRLKSYTDELDRAESVLFALARSIEARDPYTGGHCERLATFGRALGQRLGLPESALVAIERAGTVHDIGKIAIPDRILLKAGPLEEDEWILMRQHTVTGEKICAPVRSFREVLPIIRSHHERLDGSGYPDGLAGEQIPITARVLQVVDVFDALTTERPYKRAMPLEQAMGVLREEMARGWWDREVLGAFEHLMGEREDLRRLVPRTDGSNRVAGA